MKYFRSLIHFGLCCFLPVLLYGQGGNIEPDLITTLDNAVAETSGLVIVDNRLITHNDSGGKPILYEIDSTTGDVVRTVFVEHALNVDWEDLSRDESYIYIGDFGNNSGTRQDLVIYRVRITDYLSTPNDTVTAETIYFSYAGQTGFEPDPARTPYDAEALINLHDSLFIFTKNHTAIQSDIYPVPKIPGTYDVQKSDSVKTGGVITGGTYDSESGLILLTGYNQLGAFIMEISESERSYTSSNKTYLKLEGSKQVESIYPAGNGHYLVTAEGYSQNWPALLRFRLNTVTGAFTKVEPGVHIYPNPATTTAHIPYPETYEVEIISITGLKVLSGKTGITDVSTLKPGTYLVRVKDEYGKFIAIEKLIIR